VAAVAAAVAIWVPTAVLGSSRCSLKGNIKTRSEQPLIEPSGFRHETPITIKKNDGRFEQNGRSVPEPAGCLGSHLLLLVRPGGHPTQL
jgi:hypothetical protein